MNVRDNPTDSTIANQAPAGATEYPYWAFISYSHQDRDWASWLHRTLEIYRVPRRLVGRASRFGPLPRRLFPVFRDRDELPSSAELGAVINQALAGSRYLIVICSPRAAASRWVNEEVRYFKSLGRADRVLCLIVDGEPNASAVPGRAAEECFAPALRFDVDAGGRIGATPAEPIAADARIHADGKSGARIKLIAGLLGVGLDELRQRERQRQRWQRVQAAAAALAFAAVLAGVWQWFSSQRAAREREIVIEKIVETGRQELLAGRQARAAVYLNQVYGMGHATPALRFMLAQAMKPVEALTGVRVKHAGFGLYRGAAVSPDGRLFVLGAKTSDTTAVFKLYDAATGAALHDLPQAPLWPLAIEFLPEDRLLVTGFPDETQAGAPFTAIWNLAAPAAPLTLAGVNGHAGRAVSADGSRVLIAGAAGLELRDTRDGRLIATRARGRAIAAASYSPDGRLLALADATGLVEIQSAEDGDGILKLEDAGGLEIAALQFTPDGARLLALSSRSDIRIWDAASGRLQVAFAADPTVVTQLRFNRDGRRLLTVGTEGFKVWSTARGHLLFAIARALDSYATAALDADGDTVITADSSSNVSEAWDVRSKRKMFSLDLHSAGITGADFDATGTRLLLASRDGQAEMWRLPVSPSFKYQSSQTLPYVARFDPAGRLLLAGGGDHARGTTLLFDVASGALRAQWQGHQGLVHGVDFSPDGARVATASGDGSAALWNLQGERLATLTLKPEEGFGVHFSPDGRRVLTTTSPYPPNRPSRAALWNAADGAFVAALPHEDLIYSAAFDAAGARVVTAGVDRRIKLWDARDGKPLATLQGHGASVRSVQFSADGRRILSAAEDNSVRIWDSTSGAQLDMLDNASLGVPTQAVYAPDARSVAIATEAGHIVLWFPGTQRKLLTLQGHQRQVNGLRFSPDGDLLFSHSADGTARAWEAGSGLELGVVAAHPQTLNALDLDAGASRLLAASWSLLTIADIAPEQRSAQEIAAILRCQAPWAFNTASLVLDSSAPAAACRQRP